MDTIIVEIRAAEGGADARLLAADLAGVYVKFCTKNGLHAGHVGDRDGVVTLKVTGPGALELFQHETGGHRWQRVPPTERKGRVHTSTVTVTVARETAGEAYRLDPRDVEEQFMRGSGKGGQHRNKTSTACRLKHVPTGTIVRAESERSQSQNRAVAWQELERRLAEKHAAGQLSRRSAEKRDQAGSGMRGDKRRTYRERDDTVTDHTTGKKASYGRVMAGELELLW